jgi:uncharacterized cupin superfamily protein
LRTWVREGMPPSCFRVSGSAGKSVVRGLKKPGAWSSQRHWHDADDELLIMLSGEAVLVEDEGRIVLRAGDVCAWPKGVTNGHHLINESNEDCSFIVVSAGDRNGTCTYSDIDMTFDGKEFYRKDGTPYPSQRMR